MRLRQQASILGSPLVLGAMAILVVLIGIYIANTAVNGLPFVPKYKVKAEVPDAAQLSKDADITLGGVRIGQVRSIKAEPRKNGKPIAILNLDIEKKYEPIPVDTAIVVRTSGSLGRKYVSLTMGHSRKMIPNDGTLALRNAHPETVDIDQFLNIFRKPVRTGIKRSLASLGYGLAGQGPGINAAIGEFAPLLRDAQPVLRKLADPNTDLSRFVRSLADLVGELAPVAQQQANLYVDLERTFRAFASVARPDLQESISRTPPLFEATHANYVVTNRALDETSGLLADLRPAADLLPNSTRILGRALDAGAQNLPDVPTLSERLVPTLAYLGSYSQDPVVLQGLARIALFTDTLGPLVRFLTPAQTTCNYLALFVRNVASLFREGVATGTTVRVGGVVIGVATNSERGPANAIYRGKAAKALGPLHSNPYPYTASPGQPNECESGHESYVQNRVEIGNAPGKYPAKTESAKLP